MKVANRRIFDVAIILIQSYAERRAGQALPLDEFLLERGEVFLTQAKRKTIADLKFEISEKTKV
jgi:hypothetical protein